MVGGANKKSVVYQILITTLLYILRIGKLSVFYVTETPHNQNCRKRLSFFDCFPLISYMVLYVKITFIILIYGELEAEFDVFNIQSFFTIKLNEQIQ